MEGLDRIVDVLVRRGGLSPRLREVARLLVLGFDDEELERVLRLKHGTVRSYIGLVCARVGATNRRDLVRVWLTAEHPSLVEEMEALSVEAADVLRARLNPISSLD